MDVIQIKRRCKHKGITLRVPKDKDTIQATPKWKFMEDGELVEGCKENKDELMKTLLLDQAQAFLNERFVQGARLQVIARWERGVEEARDEPMHNYRTAIRAYVEAGLEEFREAAKK